METNIEELQLQPTQVEPITPKKIAEVIQEIRREKAVWTQFYRTNRDLERTGGEQVIFPKKQAGITVKTDMSAGASLDPSNITYDAVTISIKKHGIGIGILGEAIRKAARDVIADQIREAGMMWSDAEDILALEAMCPAKTFTQTAPGTYALTFPVVGVKSVSGAANISSITNYATSSSIVITGGVTMTYWAAPDAGAKKVVSGSITAKDILELRGELLGLIVSPTVMCMHPDRLPDIIYDPAVKFAEQAARTGAGFPYRSQIGRLWDMNVIVSGRVPRSAVILLDPEVLGYRITRKELNLVRDEITGLRADTLYYWGFAEINYGVVETDAYGVVALETVSKSPNVWRISP